MRRVILSLAPLAFTALGPVSAGHAQTPITVVKTPDGASYVQRVRYADLDLAQKGQRKLLLQRVGNAIASVCKRELGPSPLYQAEASCRDWAWRRSRPQVERAVASRLAGVATFASAAQIVVTSP